MTGGCNGRCLNDDEAIEVVELLCLAMEMCKTADSFVSVALERVCGISTDTSTDSELRRDAARLTAMLSSVARPADPVTGDRR